MATTEGEIDAYFISGHGGNGFDTFVVPANCIIVVQAHEGEPLESNVSGVRADDEFTIEKLCRQDFKHPLEHKVDLIENFGSLAFYKGGDTCPNFTYTLKAEYPLNVSYVMYLKHSSGVIDLQYFKEHESGKLVGDDRVQMYNKYESRVTDIDILINMFIEHYKNIHSFMYSIFMQNIRTSTPSFQNIIDDVVQYPNLLTQMKGCFEWCENAGLLDIDQKDLCNMIKTEKTQIFYNFICRTRVDVNLYNMPKIHSEPVLNRKRFNQKVITRKPLNYLASTETTKKAMRSHIEEAEGHRKAGIRNVFNRIFPPNTELGNTWIKTNATNKWTRRVGGFEKSHKKKRRSARRSTRHSRMW